MFARYSSDRYRMKGTGVVQGLKSLIHSQLPLTAKESQRLLTALTSSFRRHLDEVHPQNNGQKDIKDKPTSTTITRPSVHAIHSSASYAEQHLASVLTNPLLSTKGGKILDYASAKVELVKGHDDPVKLLEEYHDQGAASVNIADLCLDTFLNTISKSSLEQQKAQSLKFQSGRRTLIWLLKSGLVAESNFLDNVLFQEKLVRCLLLEDQQERLWEWLRLDIQQNLNRKPDTFPGGYERDMLRKYRWRGRLLRCMVNSTLYPTGKPKQSEAPIQQVHDALDVFLRAYDLAMSTPPTDHAHWLAYLAPYMLLTKEVGRRRWLPRKGLDPQRFERFQQTALKSVFMGIVATKEFVTLDLIHPERPSADRAYTFLREIYGDLRHSRFSTKAREDFDEFVNYNPSQTAEWWHTLVRTIFLLRKDSRNKEAGWVTSVAKQQIPRFASKLEGDLQRHYLHSGLQPDLAPPSSEQEVERVPLPSFV